MKDDQYDYETDFTPKVEHEGNCFDCTYCSPFKDFYQCYKSGKLMPKRSLDFCGEFIIAIPVEGA